MEARVSGREAGDDLSRVDIPGASHMMHEDNAAAYNRAVLSFLARCG